MQVPLLLLLQLLRDPGAAAVDSRTAALDSCAPDPDPGAAAVDSRAAALEPCAVAAWKKAARFKQQL